MATAVYLLCALTSIACAALLLSAYRRNRARLLLWTFMCFAWLAINNVLLVVDLALVQDVDLSTPRVATALAGVTLLLYGLIYDTERGGRR
jgi:hypothetical protein